VTRSGSEPPKSGGASVSAPAGRFLAFTDYVYRQIDGTIYADRAFAVFLAAVSEHVEELTIIGRLHEQPGTAHYPLPDNVRFVPLPNYRLTSPQSVVASLFGALRKFNQALSQTDCVWLFGPQPHAVLFALLTRAKRKRLVLGVRQDYPSYVRSRRPHRRWMHHCADLLEWTWRTLGRRSRVVVVGPQLARHYRHSEALLPITVSLITSDDVDRGEQLSARAYDGELQLLSVGRLDTEKNPLLLADVLARLREADPRWRLLVYGEGPMKDALAQRLEDLELSEFAQLRGYVPVHDGLLDAYRESHAFLHVSLTEGMPQVLLEAFASGLPVVATAVGGVADAAGDAALLIPPRDITAAAAAVARTAADPELRRTLIASGLRRARAHTLDAETLRLARFMSEETALV
jgi:glycosyltransferase involved in cell wall biosynthesis